MSNSKTTNVKAAQIPSKQYSERYNTVRGEAETKWPAWKVSTYNSNIAVSAHAKKVLAK